MEQARHRAPGARAISRSISPAFPASSVRAGELVLSAQAGTPPTEIEPLPGGRDRAR